MSIQQTIETLRDEVATAVISHRYTRLKAKRDRALGKVIDILKKLIKTIPATHEYEPMRATYCLQLADVYATCIGKSKSAKHWLAEGLKGLNRLSNHHFDYQADGIKEEIQVKLGEYR